MSSSCSSCTPKLSVTLTLCQLILVLVSLCHGYTYYAGLQNSRVQAATYLTSAVSKILVTAEIKNTGDQKTDTYLLSLPKSLESKLAYLQVTDSSSGQNLAVTALPAADQQSVISAMHKNHKNKKLDLKTDTNAKDYIFYEVSLPFTLQPPSANDEENNDDDDKDDKDDADADKKSSEKKKKKKTAKSKSKVQLKITCAYVHMLAPLPKKIKKDGKQFVTFAGNLYWYSPYVIAKLGVKYILASDKIKSSVKDATSVEGKKLGYGPFTDLMPLSFKTASFHFQFAAPYLTMTSVERDIEVSHWGNVRCEEKFFLVHNGAQLKGAYEVSMMDRIRHSDSASVRGLKAVLPKNANNVAYVDRIGNISTSNFRTEKTRSVLEMKPRYPLYGGWKTDFTIGYDVPAQDLISIDRETHVHTLNVSFAIPFREPVTDLLIVKIALPEGAHDIEIHSPYDINIIDDGKVSKRFTYLDSRFGGGRPLITFTKENVVNLHSEYFQISYIYDETRIYFKPGLIITGIFLFLSFIMFLGRINPSLDDGQKQIDANVGKPGHGNGNGSGKGHGNSNSGGGSSGNGSHSHSSDNSPDIDSSHKRKRKTNTLRNATEIVMAIDVDRNSVSEMIASLAEAKRGDIENADIKQRLKKAHRKAKKYAHISDKVKLIVTELQAQL